MTVLASFSKKRPPAPYVVTSEWGLLWFVCRSRMNEAMEISKWLINKALPQIRKAYAAPVTPPSILGIFSQLFKSLHKQQETVPAKEASDE